MFKTFTSMSNNEMSVPYLQVDISWFTSYNITHIINQNSIKCFKASSVTHNL